MQDGFNLDPGVVAGLPDRERKRCKRRLREYRIAPGQGIQAGPAVPNPDCPGGDSPGDLRTGFEAAALVEHSDRCTVGDSPRLGICGRQPQLGCRLARCKCRESTGMIVEAVKMGEGTTVRIDQRIVFSRALRCWFARRWMPISTPQASQ